MCFLSLKVYIDEIDDHRPAIEVIKVTEEFLLEHTRKSEHDDIQQRVKYILEGFETLEGSERVSYFINVGVTKFAFVDLCRKT